MDIAQSSNSKAQNKVLVLLQQSLTNLKTPQATFFFIQQVYSMDGVRH